MKTSTVSQIALATQLVAAAAGLSFLAPAFAVAQDNPPSQTLQKMNPADRELARKVRRAVVADKDLSTEAHNINISAQDGMVTLVGNVKSDDEKKSIESKATEIAGDGKVTSNLTVR